MQEIGNLNQITEEIISLAIDRCDHSSLLEQLASIVGNYFKIDACIVISAQEKVPQSLALGWWSQNHFPVVDIQVLQQSCFELLQQTEANRCLIENAFPLIFTPQTTSLSVINFSDRTHGAVVLLKSSGFWDSEEKQQLNAIQNSLAIAISQLQLKQKIETQARYQNLLNSLSTKIAESSDINSLYHLALSEIGKALKIDKANIITVKYKDPFFIQKKRGQKIQATLTVVKKWSAAIDNVALPERFSFELANSDWFQKALNSAPKPLVVNQEANFPDLEDRFLPQNISSHSSALLMIPLVGKNTSETQPALVLGFLVLQRDRPYIWNTEEVNLVNWIGVQLGTALIHHQTLTQVQSIVEERTSQLQWSVDVQAKLSEKMRQQIEQLKKLNELKDDFLSSMSHELKTPMTSMKMAIKMLRQDIPDRMREKYLDILEQEWNREYNLIKDLLTLQQVESGELAFTPQELDLKQIMADLSLSFAQRWHSEKGLTIETALSDSDLYLYSDFDSLQHILSELLLNAGKYSDADTTVYLSAKAHPTFKGKEVQITVDNYGVEINPQELPHIFDKFRRGKGVTDRAVPGTGLGLTLVKHLVEHLHGNIEVTNEAVKDSDLFKTTFTIALPQYK